MQVGYQYASEPRSVVASRPTYREDNEPPSPQNLMFDKRVVRGSTRKPRAAANNNYSNRQPNRRPNRRQKYQNSRVKTPDAVEGRVHNDVQTELYLEELTDEVSNADGNTQTDSYIDRPPSPIYVPAKTGVDVTTQIETGDLFDFTAEVEPLLEVLVAKTMEVSMMEVLEEEELRQIRANQDRFEQCRNAELIELQRLEAEAKRKASEKDRRICEAKEKLEAKKLELEATEARAFTKNCLSSLHKSVFTNLMSEGHFKDPVETEVTEGFMPFLIQNACARVEQVAAARALTDLILVNITSI